MVGTARLAPVPVVVPGLPELIQAVGSGDFGNALLAFIQHQICPIDQLVAYTLVPAGTGIQIFTVGCLPPRLANSLTRRYLDSYHLIDPSSHTGAECGEHDIVRMNPDTPASSVYKSFFFARGGLSDRIAFQTHWQATRLACHLYRSAASEQFAEEDLSRLRPWVPTLSAMLRQHYVLAYASTPVDTPATPDPRKTALAALSTREREVFHRLLAGLSAEAIALDLGVSVNTVRTFRKKLYRKLEVASRFDLYHKYVHHAPGAPGKSKRQPGGSRAAR